jgi:peptidoglycan/LPS O-acetylase OafA/YrhL
VGLLRLFLAVVVVIGHAGGFYGVRSTGGMVAVEVFFIISGFYMTMILEEKYIGKGSYVLFLTNRFLRLYPLFWVVLFLTILASIISSVFVNDWFRLSPYIEYFDTMAVETLLFQIAANIALVGQDIVMFLGMNQETGAMYFTSNFRTTDPMFYKFLFIPQAWSLGIEVMFYLVAPFIVRKSNIFIGFLVIFSISIRLFTYLYLDYTNDPWTYRFFPSELALFLLGTISYRLYKSNKIQEISFMRWKLKYFISTLFFIILIFYQFIPKVEFRDINIIDWLFFALCCLSLPFIFELSKSVKFDARIGELSYPIYISHNLVIFILSPFIAMTGWQQHKGIMAVFLTIIFSYILVRLISDPIEKIRRSRVKAAHQA